LGAGDEIMTEMVKVDKIKPVKICLGPGDFILWDS